MSSPCKSKYETCQLVGCNKPIECYDHPDEPYCPEHKEEYDKFCQFLRRYNDENQTCKRLLWVVSKHSCKMQTWGAT